MATDTFTGANGTPLSANWIVKANATDIIIQDNAAAANNATAYPFGNEVAYWNPAVTGAANDQYSQGTIIFPGGSPSGVVGVGVRFNVDGEGYVGGYLTGGSDQAGIFYTLNVPGSGLTAINLGFDGVTWNSGDLMRLEVSGTTLSLYRNGVLTMSLVDTTYAAGQYGIAFAGANTGIQVDDWTGSNLSALSINVSDGAFPSDAPRLDLLLLITKAETVTLSELVLGTTGTITLSIADTVLVTEAIFVGSGSLQFLSAFDAVTVTDATTLQFSRFFATVNDVVVVTDGGIAFAFAQNTLAVNVNDLVGMLDVISITSFQGLAINVNDAIGVNRGFALLDWNANTDPDLLGYKIYQGTASGVYTTIYDVGNVLTYTVLNLVFGTTYYFAITAYDTSGNESSFSSEVSKTPTDVLLGAITLSMNIFTVNDATTVTDSPQMMLLVTMRALETAIIMTEGLTVLRPFNAVAPFDSTAMTDALTVTFTTFASLTVSLGDTVIVLDVPNVNFSGLLLANDATVITDSPQMMMLVSKSVNDASTITDASTAQIILSGPLTALENVTVVDVITVQMSRILLSVNDTILMSDGRSSRIGTGGRGRLTNVTGTSPDTVLT